MDVPRALVIPARCTHDIVGSWPRLETICELSALWAVIRPTGAPELGAATVPGNPGTTTQPLAMESRNPPPQHTYRSILRCNARRVSANEGRRESAGSGVLIRLLRRVRAEGSQVPL